MTGPDDAFQPEMFLPNSNDCVEKSEAERWVIRKRGEMPGPLVSCVMPTYGRPDFVAESIALFLAQDYENKELLILNDCPGQILSGDFPQVRIINAATRWSTLGEKRNALIEQARGQLIAVWDDDDVYFSWRISQAVSFLQDQKAYLYCPAEYWAYWGADALHDNQARLDWIYHPLVVFSKDVWTSVGGYPSQTKSEDTVFMRKVLAHLGREWPQVRLPRWARPMILRGCSKYEHTSIDGGRQPPDTRPGERYLRPCEIQDPILRAAHDRLLKEYQMATRLRTTAQRQWLGFPQDVPTRWLDAQTPVTVHVGYGELGTSGQLGYEDKSVDVGGQSWTHALSAHGPSRLVYELTGSPTAFACHVALNEDVAPDAGAADFFVYAEGRLVGVARNVRPLQRPRFIQADIRGARRLELVVHPVRWEFCHAVWLDPVLIDSLPKPLERVFTDSLGRAEMTVPADLPPASACLATVASPGYESWLEDLLGSVSAHSSSTGLMVAVFALNPNAELQRIAEKFHSILIPCRPLRHLDVSFKSILYSAGHLIPAEKFLCVDADTLVLDDLQPILSAIDAAPPGTIFACREGNRLDEFGDAWKSMYAWTMEVLEELIGLDASRAVHFPLVVNDGLFAGSRAALCGLDALIRNMPGAAAWIDDPQAAVPWRNQAIFNLALAQGQIGAELDSRFNSQLHSQAIDVESQSAGGHRVRFSGRRAALVHFNGWGRHHHPEIRGNFRQTPPPLSHTGGGKQYEAFLAALRRWLGPRGINHLAWSFYGMTDGQSGRVPDSTTFPLWAMLHYLIRANGCQQVIETGTARGISAACLASAVSHRPQPRVVTLDLECWPDRAAFWEELPATLRDCIEPRQVDALQGLEQARGAGERYQAALLDSVHTAEHVLKEFELASQLVCPGGLILIHDATWAPGTVTDALDEIGRRGYGVVRLWTADAGFAEDDGLGLAVIENRQRK